MDFPWQVFPAVFLVFIVILILFFAGQKFETRQLTITNSENKKIEIQAEIADNTAKRMRGLMFRESLGENEGMLFVFNKSAKYGFWMVNTTIPLDAIFFNSNFEVVDILAMDPCGLNSCKIYTTEENAMYVLEVNQGFAEKNSIEKGNRMTILG